MRNKGFINILVVVTIGVGVILSGILYADYVKKEAIGGIFGAVASTTELTDTVNTLRTNVNTINDNTFASSTWLKTANNLADSTTSTARTNLGLGTAALQNATYFLQVANNLSDSTTSTVRTNLGLGDAALTASSTYLKVANNGSDINSTSTFRNNLGTTTSTFIGYVAPGGSGNVLTSDGTTWTSASSSEGISVSYIASLSSTTIGFSNDAQRNQNSTTTAIKLKEIKTINDLAAVKVMCDVAGESSQQGYYQLYKNGTAIGVLHASLAYATFVDNATSSKGDLLQIYGYNTVPATNVFVKNFRLYYDQKIVINHVNQDP